MNFQEKKQNLESLLQEKLEILRRTEDSKNKLIEEIILIRGKIDLLMEIEKENGAKQQQANGEDGGANKNNS